MIDPILAIADPSMIEALCGEGLCYLATPYSKYPSGLAMAWVDACRVAGALIRAGVKVYSPIAHGHPIADFANMDKLDHSLWLPFDEAMMETCNALVVA